MLVSKEKCFEVVACNDASTDNAQELLTKIHDKRFHYYHNEKNLGAHKNWEHSLELGRGQWLFLVMDRDRLQGEFISRLINILLDARENNITLFIDGHFNETKIYSGINSMIKFIGYNHPTGIIFNGELFRTIPNRTRYFEISDMYPENYVKRDLLLQGRGAYIKSGVYNYPDFLIDKVKIKSTVENDKNIFDTFYAPKRRTQQFFEFINMIDELENFSTKERDKFFRRKFYEMLLMVSFGWRGMCKTHQWQAHYGQGVRHVRISEMLQNIFTSFHATKIHLKEHGTYTSYRQLLMYYCTAKAIVYYPIRLIARKILEPLGIWAIIKRIKG